jgi:hypothetical protein
VADLCSAGSAWCRLASDGHDRVDGDLLRSALTPSRQACSCHAIPGRACPDSRCLAAGRMQATPAARTNP